jgi:hypothetical protein
MGDPDGVAEDRGLDLAGLIDVDSPDELDQLARLGTQVRPLGIDRLPNEVESHWDLPRISDAR